MNRRHPGPRRPAPAPLPDDDDRLVRRAAEAACVSEFDFFRAAARAWFGRAAEDKALERVFVAYLFHLRVPAFVRHFARRILAARAAGPLNRADFGLDGLRPVQRPRQYVHPLETAVVYAVLALSLLVAL